MIQLPRILFLVLALPFAGCGSSSTKPAAPAPEPASPVAAASQPVPACEPVIARMMEMMRSQITDVPEQHRPVIDRMFDQLDDALLASCVEDGWSDELKRCIAAAKTDEEMNVCSARGNAELEAKIRPRIEPILEEASRAMTASAPAAAGADTGGQPAPEVSDAAIATTQGPSGIAACDAYVATAKRFIACKGISEEARTNARNGLDSAKQTWNRLKGKDIPVDVKKAFAGACIQIEATLAADAQAAGCKL